ncbi:MAG: MOSC domain-containing protein [Gammaproteobacteria bacterium]|nr:MOSC domain-containing protein [Gammaproteobacteria bacterium]
MKLISVSVGRPRAVAFQGKSVTTGIFKEPVAGRVRLHRLNLEGDGQADLTVHGGLDKAVYAYPAEHYTFWGRELPARDLPWGMFGENFTTEGLREEDIRLGDRFRIGTAELVVTQPRLPCYKLGIKFGDMGMVKRFLSSRRTGFYLSVAGEGEVGAGDSVELLARDPAAITVADVTRLYAFERDDREGLKRALTSEVLPEGWRDYFQKQLDPRASGGG